MKWLPLIGGIGVAAALALLVWLYGNAREKAGKLAERAEWREVAAKAERVTLEAALKLEQRKSQAQTVFSERQVQLQPIIERSQETVRAYALTNAGRAPCLPSDRVRGILADRQALFAGVAEPAGGGAEAVPAFGAAPER